MLTNPRPPRRELDPVCPAEAEKALGHIRIQIRRRTAIRSGHDRGTTPGAASSASRRPRECAGAGRSGRRSPGHERRRRRRPAAIRNATAPGYVGLQAVHRFRGAHPAEVVQVIAVFTRGDIRQDGSTDLPQPVEIDAGGQSAASSPIADPLPPQGQDDNDDDHDENNRPDADIHLVIPSSHCPVEDSP